MNEHTSLELSKRLHEKGFRGEHTWVWVHHYEDGDMIWTLCPIDEDDVVNKQIPAYTFTEIWAGLPSHIEHDGRYGILVQTKAPGDFTNVSYRHYRVFGHPSPAEAAGLLMEWLIDNNHVKGGN